RVIAWQLFKGCAFTTCGLILLLFSFKMLIITIARWILVWFGGLSFLLVFMKEEFLRIVVRSKIAQAQYRRRFLLVGTGEDMTQMRTELNARSELEGIDIVGELNLNETSVEQLVQMMHEHSVNGVILNAKHA